MRTKLILHVLMAMVSVFLWTGTCFAEEVLPTTEQVVQGIVRAYGGPEVMERTSEVFAQGKITAFMRNDSGIYTRYLQRPDKLRVETLYERSAERRILNGPQGWRSVGMAPFLPAAGPNYLAMFYQYVQLDLPYELHKGHIKIESITPDLAQGAKAYKLNLSVAEGLKMEALVDASSFLVLSARGEFTVMGQKTDLGIEFKEYKVINGAPLPFRMVNYARGMRISETVIESYSLDQGIKESLFLP